MTDQPNPYSQPEESSGVLVGEDDTGDGHTYNGLGCGYSTAF